ncbi:glucose-6-phosphate dehydrogenase (coenzyme-F420) [Actinoalloteichus hymeniacidonis]|uniref:Glucose-6-phosphate dehydrogenase (Coenzyme-F420) n=1 Tax=Actinoalloteichus hymeniacidonis TaxID=340345 RepID=A0AAC9MXX1_9PSEU|nr:glucose-6-phosphate dehydrogenase (coenzyme-F420) [Actinoalloteichus hymeniacidonis]AOS62715.1 glucose-6-phosphate dehydrogenase (coenzyme-F420) [Actinoalloteichus hymeniacidonis]MBB5909254.1 coenzyme F420-dependent glucose-6-phosphate dehydrogenase [Actinoalloteichus hymeniacidonis]
MLKIGYKASAEQFEPRTLLKFGVLAEEAGFDSVMISDHFQPWKHTDGHAPYAFAWLGALGERTSRVQIGTSVLTPTFRHHPSLVAQATATLGVLFPGRVILGVGTGESLNEVPATGMEWPEYKERFERLGESVGLIRELWQRDFVSHEGTYYRTENATIYDRPADSVPIFIAAGGPRMARFAGRTGDGMICTSGKGVELYRDKLLPGLIDGATKAGRDPNSVERMIEVKVSFDLDRARAMEDTRNWAALALPPESKVGVEDPREMERLAAELTAEQAASRWIVSDDAEQHVEQIKAYLDLGFDHLVFHAPGEDQKRFLELYAEQVLPLLRKLSPATLG